MTDGIGIRVEPEIEAKIAGAVSRGIKSAQVNAGGELVLTMTDLSSLNLGTVKGAKGDTGATGAKGDKGEQGNPGIAGATGATGAKGDKGEQGNPGMPGATGATGATGAKGDKGDPGVSATSQTVNIAVADWTAVTGGYCTTKSGITGVTADSIVLCDSSDARVSCTGQGGGFLTFNAPVMPAEAVMVKVVLL